MKATKILDFVQIFCEILVAIYFMISVLPFGFSVSIKWILLLTTINLILSILSKNETISLTVANFMAAWVSLVPVVGFFARLTGIVLSAVAVDKLGKRKHEELHIPADVEPKIYQ